MALRGNLKELSLPDIFQLVTFSGKTGVLRIRRSDGAQGSVWFREGEVFFAQSNWRAELLGERLVRAQRITPMALERALELRAREMEGGRRLGEILVDEGYITDKVLEAFVQEQMQDTIFDLMRWDEGDFEFEAMPDAPEEDIGLAVSIENVIMEGSRRLDEWNRIKKKIPSTGIVFKMATAPGEGTFEISLKPIEWNLLLLVDGTRSVAELAQETNRTDFEVARIVYGLFSAGLLEFASDEEVAASRAERKAREAKLEAKHVAEDAQARTATEAAAQASARAASALAAASASAAPFESSQSDATVTARPAPTAVPAEVPEFLGADQSAASQDDFAVLEAAMGAVLDIQTTVPAPAPSQQPATYTPGEEPAFIAASQETQAEDTESAPSVEELLADITGLPTLAVPGVAPELEAAAPAEPVEEFEPDLQSVAAPLEETEAADKPALELEPGTFVVVPGPPSAQITPEAAPIEPGLEPPAPTPTAPSTSVPPGLHGFEQDLMALGLGELPPELRAHEPAGLAPPGVTLDEEFELEPVVEPMGVSVPPAIASDTLKVDGVAVEAGAQPASQAGKGVDFSALLESLDISADDAHAVVQPTIEAPQPDLSVETLLGAPQAEPAGVISTDVFLDDLTLEQDFGFSGELTDELSALTGADRPVRPAASVRRLPAEGEAMLHRDVRVDRETMLKIIDGIKNL